MDKLLVIYTLPMVSNISHVILMMATLACALITPAAAGALLLLLPSSSSSVFAQQQEETSSLGEEEREDLGSGIASDVLDSVGLEDEDEQEGEENDGAATGNDDGNTNTQIAVPITDQDQRDANLAEQLGLNADILEREEVIPTPTPTSEEEDTTPPTLTVHDIVAEATSTAGAVVTFRVTAQDNVDGTATLEQDGTTVTQDDVGGDITISCTTASGSTSGSTFPIGTTTVNCEATDAAGNRATASFRVTVADTTPPEITGVPADITVQATSLSGATVSYTPTATDAVDGSVAVTCNPASGTTFPIGPTTVTCTATDAAFNTATESFTITVNPITCAGQKATIVGTPGDDRGDNAIVGTEGRDVIAALGGDDEIVGLGGNDVICGDEGTDTMNGGDGKDAMFGGDGNDNMNGGDGIAEEPDDTMNGNAGDDNMNGGGGDDAMFGGDGGDTMNGGGGDDFMNGNAGDDTLDSRDRVRDNDHLNGGDGTADICRSDPDPEFFCELD